MKQAYKKIFYFLYTSLFLFNLITLEALELNKFEQSRIRSYDAINFKDYYHKESHFLNTDGTLLALEVTDGKLSNIERLQAHTSIIHVPTNTTIALLSKGSL